MTSNFESESTANPQMAHALETTKNGRFRRPEYSTRCVFAWANKKPSAWRIREEAFKTKGKAGDDGEENIPVFLRLLDG